MIFRSLLEVEHDNAGNISREALKILLPRTPEDVIEQFYADHGRNEDFQIQYSDLDISNIEWKEKLLGLHELSSLCIYPEFKQWFEACKHRSKGVSDSNNWAKIQNSADVIHHWEKNHTWVRPIVALQDKKGSLRLVEGHTRLGTLLGLVESGMSIKTRNHKVWIGKFI